MKPVVDKNNLYKISDLARETGVSTATIKFYMREGLLPKPTLKTGRNMAYYDRSFIDRIRVIKELQKKRYLPLDVIRAIIDHDSTVISQREVDTLLSVEGTFYEAINYAPGSVPVSRAEAVEKFGLNPEELDYSIELGVVTPVIHDGVEYFEGDDVLLLEVFSKLEEAGFNSELIPHEVTLPIYVEAIDRLAAEELKLFTRAVTDKVGEDRVPDMALAGVKLIEQFIVLLRRKRLLKAVQELRQETKSTGTHD